jgi:hypothetical protein
MSDIANAAEAAKNLAHQFRSIIQIGDMLESVGNIEQHAEEVTRQRDQAVVDRDAAVLELETAHQNLDDANQLVADALARATATENTANERAAQIVEDGRVEGRRLIDAAQHTADGIGDQIEARRGTLLTLNEQILGARTELDNLNAQIDAVRRSAAAIAG